MRAPLVAVPAVIVFFALPAPALAHGTGEFFLLYAMLGGLPYAIVVPGCIAAGMLNRLRSSSPDSLERAGQYFVTATILPLDLLAVFTAVVLLIRVLGDIALFLILPGVFVPLLAVKFQLAWLGDSHPRLYEWLARGVGLWLLACIAAMLMMTFLHH